MNDVLGRYLTPLVVLADDPADARRIAERLRAAGDLADSVAEVRTIDDVVPADQPARAAEARSLRAELTPRMLASLEPSDRARLERALEPAGLEPFDARQVPPTLLTGLVEVDGAVGKSVLVYPRFSSGLWNRAKLEAFVDRLREVAGELPREPRGGRVAGSQAVTADLLRSLEHDGPLATGVALVGVVGIVLVLFGVRATTGWVLASLVVAVLWLFAASRGLGIKINFANFIAFPITFGIGVDYAVNVVARWEQAPRAGVLAAVRAVGGAVALCSATTVIGYSSLLIAKNRALSLFGVLAVGGEIACLATALFALPAIVVLVERRRARTRMSRAATPALGREHRDA
jgi:uncharacterized membrane protein YdfJ with MMPL/SSD domain